MRALRAAALLLLPGLALQVTSSTSAGATDSTAADDESLTVVVTAAGTVARSYEWSVDKVADTAARSTGTTGTATFAYTVTTRAGAMTESGWALGGEVTVTNPHPSTVAAGVSIATTLGGGSSCAVIGATPVVVPASGQLTLPFACTFSSAPTGSGSVSATVTWDSPGDGGSASAVGSAPAAFTVTSETNRTVTVVDDQTVPGQRVVLDPALTWSAGLVKTYAYDLALTGGAPGACTPYTNTATVDQPTGTDPSAGVTVRACVPEVLPLQAFGRASGSVSASCRGTVRTRLSNRTASTVTYRLKVGTQVRRISVRSLSQKKVITRGRALAKVTLKVRTLRLDRIRIPQRCEAPEVLPDTGLRAASR